MLEALESDEVAALIGHEIAHFILLEGWNHRYRIMEELLHALLRDQSSQPVHAESYRLFHLYKEVFCDRAALLACGSLNAAITLLVKIETGVTDVSTDSYLPQTEEIFSKDGVTTDGLSHPECYIRARALKLWSEQTDESRLVVSRPIGGPTLPQGL